MKTREDILIKGCLDSKRKHQQALYEMFRVPMYMLCLRYASCQADAQDILQDGFIKVYRDLHQFDSRKGTLKGWVRKVMVNTALQYIRSKKDVFQPADQINGLANMHSEEEQVLPQLGAKELTKLIQSLPEGYRIVFNMYVIEGYSHKEIAETLGVSVSTSKTQLFKAKAMLKKRIYILEKVAVK